MNVTSDSYPCLISELTIKWVKWDPCIWCFLSCSQIHFGFWSMSSSSIWVWVYCWRTYIFSRMLVLKRKQWPIGCLYKEKNSNIKINFNRHIKNSIAISYEAYSKEILSDFDHFLLAKFRSQLSMWYDSAFIFYVFFYLLKLRLSSFYDISLLISF